LLIVCIYNINLVCARVGAGLRPAREHSKFMGGFFGSI